MSSSNRLRSFNRPTAGSLAASLLCFGDQSGGVGIMLRQSYPRVGQASPRPKIQQQNRSPMGRHRGRPSIYATQFSCAGVSLGGTPKNLAGPRQQRGNSCRTTRGLTTNEQSCLAIESTSIAWSGCASAQFLKCSSTHWASSSSSSSILVWSVAEGETEHSCFCSNPFEAMPEEEQSVFEISAFTGAIELDMYPIFNSLFWLSRPKLSRFSEFESDDPEFLKLAVATKSESTEERAPPSGLSESVGENMLKSGAKGPAMVLDIHARKTAWWNRIFGRKQISGLRNVFESELLRSEGEKEYWHRYFLQNHQLDLLFENDIFIWEQI